MYNDDDDMVELNWNNISTVKRDAFRMLFDGLRRNTNLTALSLANTRLTDSAAEHLLEALRSNKHLRILNVESNYLSGNMLKVRQMHTCIHAHAVCTPYRKALTYDSNTTNFVSNLTVFNRILIVTMLAKELDRGTNPKKSPMIAEGDLRF